MGLRIMRYRAGMIGGALAIQQASGGGTTVACAVHLPDPIGPQRKPQTTLPAGARRRFGQAKASGGKSKTIRNQSKPLRKQ